MIADCTAIILAGGDSRRMGQDKATLALGNRPLIAHVADTLRPLFRDVRVSVRHPRADLDWPQIVDRQPDAGPLAGLCAALAQVASEPCAPAWIFAVATDMPFIQAGLIERLAQEREGCEAVVAVVDGHPQPLAAFYSVSALPTLEAILSGNGKHSLRAALASLNVRYVDESELTGCDAAPGSFFDLDTPQDLDRVIRQRLPE